MGKEGPWQGCMSQVAGIEATMDFLSWGPNYLTLGPTQLTPDYALAKW